MTAPKPSYTCRLFLLAPIISQYIRERIFDFADLIGEIITDLSYLCEPRVSELKRTFFSFSLRFELNKD